MQAVTSAHASLVESINLPACRRMPAAPVTRRHKSCWCEPVRLQSAQRHTSRCFLHPLCCLTSLLQALLRASGGASAPQQSNCVYLPRLPNAHYSMPCKGGCLSCQHCSGNLLAIVLQVTPALNALPCAAAPSKALSAGLILFKGSIAAQLEVLQQDIDLRLQPVLPPHTSGPGIMSMTWLGTEHAICSSTRLCHHTNSSTLYWRVQK